MNNIKLVQKQLSALLDTVVEETVIGEFQSRALAESWLSKRGYTNVNGVWTQGNAVQFPIRIEETEDDIFSIGSYVK